jgi:hypothetical protein
MVSSGLLRRVALVRTSTVRPKEAMNWKFLKKCKIGHTWKAFAEGAGKNREN